VKAPGKCDRSEQTAAHDHDRYQFLHSSSMAVQALAVRPQRLAGRRRQSSLPRSGPLCR
jgi:hypothetical protein